ncbi:MAG: phosphatidylserine decarboxylase [Myxococcota bacterium]
MRRPGLLPPDRVQRLIDRIAHTARRVVVGPATDKVEHAWVHGWGHPLISRLAGGIADLRLPGPLLRGFIRTYIRAFNVDMHEAAEPIEVHQTFNAFFTRALRAGARPIDAEASVLVSPADAVLTAAGPIAEGPLMAVKGVRCTAAALLGETALPPTLLGGQFGVLYLSPRDYHRVHSPVAGVVRRVLLIPGKTFPVNARGVRQVPGLLAINKRVVFELDSTEHGLIWLVMVGATNVGRIVERVQSGTAVAKGDEIGVFYLGSTVVLLTPQAATTQFPDLGEHIQLGTALWRY